MSNVLSLNDISDAMPRIAVMGIGGAGCNAINNMVEREIQNVEFIAANTDQQALVRSKANKRIQLGKEMLHGIGAGSQPEIGKAATEESAQEIQKELKGVQLLFLTTGMGGGTGTGATPVIAKIAKEMDILTVAVVTTPFLHEGEAKLRLATEGIDELKKYVDTIMIIANENLFKIADTNITVIDSYRFCDNVLYSGVKSITDLLTIAGLVNLEFSDIQTAVKKMGRVMMGTGEAEGENRAIKAVEEALSNPLLEDINISGAEAALVNVTASTNFTLVEFNEAAKKIKEKIGNKNAIIKIGSCFTEDMNEKVRVSIFVTGVKDNNEEKIKEEKNETKSITIPNVSNISSSLTPVPAPTTQSEKDVIVLVDNTKEFQNSTKNNSTTKKLSSTGFKNYDKKNFDFNEQLKDPIDEIENKGLTDFLKGVKGIFGNKKPIQQPDDLLTTPTKPATFDINDIKTPAYIRKGLLKNNNK